MRGAEGSERQDDVATRADLLRFEGLTLDLAGRTLTAADGREISLTRAEFELLSVLIRSRGRALSRDQCLDAVAGRRAEPFDRTIDVLISRLRRKIEPERKAPRLLLTVPGHGYKFAVKPAQVVANRHEPAPATAAETPSAALATPAAERRLLTVMVCSLSIGTEPPAPLDSEERHGISRAFRTCCSNICGRHGGVLGPFAGDTVHIHFGFPVAHEHDAECAVRAGLDLAQAMRLLDVGSELQTRIGIATGLVVVGDALGQGPAQEQAVVGETPNLAARLQTLAEPGAIVIDAATRRLTGGLFEYADLKPASLRGFAAPASAARVLGESATASRFEALRAASTPFVGRDEELALLARRWQQAKTGEGCAVLITGEPGIGKSRLVETLLERIAGEPHARMRCSCSPHRQDTALHPSIAELEGAAGFRREDTAEQRLDKLGLLLAEATDSPGEAAPLIAGLLSIPTANRYPPLELTPQKRKEKTLQALLTRLEDLAARQPVLMLFEDAHWSDPTSIELLDLIVDRAASLRLLLIVAFRPEFMAPWTGRPHVSLVTLNRLPPRERSAIIAGVTGGKTLPREVAEQIIDRTDGVPLFVEELTKAVIESGMLTDQGDHYVAAGPIPSLAIPATLHGSLLARLDRLAPVREVAQVGAALGRQFSHELISAVASMSQPQLDEALAQLVGAELVYRRGEPPHAVYSFKHALIRDAAYDTLLRGPRQELHARIATVLEEHFPEDTEQQPEILAQHCTNAGLTERAIGYWNRAGRKSVARSAMIEAAAQYQKGLDLLSRLPDGPDRDRKELDLQSALGRALVAWKGPAAQEAGEAYVRARTLCKKLDDTGPLVPVLMGQFAHHLMRGLLGLARRIAEDLLLLGQKKNDAIARLAGHQAMGSCLHETGEFTAAIGHHEWVLSLHDPEINRAIASVAAYDPQAIALSLLALDLFVTGNLDQATTRTEEAVSWSRQLKNHTSLCMALYISVRLNLLRRSEQAACAALEELTSIATEQRFLLFQNMAIVPRALLPSKTSSVEEGIADAREIISAEAARGTIHNQAYHLGLLAQACERAGRSEEALDALARALEMADRTDARWFDAELHRLRGEWLIVHRSSEQAEAEACFERSLAVARRQSAKMWELRAALSFARLRCNQGRPVEARDVLAPVYEWFTEGLDTPDLKEAKALLNNLA